jgi:UDP-N-acetylmuramate dehydrogenase
MDWTALNRLGLELRERAALADFTTFHLGGPCPCVVTCRSEPELAAALGACAGAAPILIGGGSNLLVSDRGLDVPVIRYLNRDPEMRIEDDEIHVSGATLLDDLARHGAESGIAGLTFLSGIPGTVGGAVAGNAGAFGKQIGDVVISVRLMNRSGEASWEDGSLMGFAYRHSRLRPGGDIVVSVRLRSERGDPQELARERAEILELRGRKHPDWHTERTAGSFFKNIEPTSAAGVRQAAGWFLEQAGAKQMRKGGAYVYPKHANIVMAGDGCSAQDVVDLSRQMSAAVSGRFGITLVPEVRLLGPFG